MSEAADTMTVAAFVRDLEALAVVHDQRADGARAQRRTAEAKEFAAIAARWRLMAAAAPQILAGASAPAAGPDPDVLAALRAPFRAGELTVRPRIVCGACAAAVEDSGAECNDHRRVPCLDCGYVMTTAHVHQESVSHVDVIRRFLDVDPRYTYRAAAYTPEGLPVLDTGGGLWMWVTVGGVERLAYGSSNGLRDGSAVQAALSNCLRLAGKLFGVPLGSVRENEGQDDEDVLAVDAEVAGDVPMASAEQINSVIAELTRRGVRSRTGVRRALRKILGGQVSSPRGLNAAEAETVLAHLTGRAGGARTVLAMVGAAADGSEPDEAVRS